MANIYQVGIHRFRHGSIADDLTELMGHDQAIVFYSDPPWGDGNLRYWDTMNIKMNRDAKRQEHVLTCAELLEREFSILSAYLHRQGIAFIEYGQQWASRVEEACDESGFVHGGRYKAVYKSGSSFLPLDIHLVAKSKDVFSYIPPDYAMKLSAMYGYNTLETAVSPFHGWSDEAICNELGMEPEELLRLKHITGFSKLFADAQYSRAWKTKNQILLEREWKAKNVL